MKSNLFLIVDLETTGLGWDAGITEITIKGLREDGKVFNVINQLTDPGKITPQVVVDLNGLDNNMLVGLEKFEDTFYRLSSIINNLDKYYNLYVVAHNAVFEEKFFAIHLSRMSYNKIKFVCTRANFGYIKDKEISRFKKDTKLSNAAKEYGFEYDLSKAHRAEYDVDLTIEVFKKQLESLSVYEMENIYKKFKGVK